MGYIPGFVSLATVSVSVAFALDVVGLKVAGWNRTLTPRGAPATLRVADDRAGSADRSSTEYWAEPPGLRACEEGATLRTALQAAKPGGVGPGHELIPTPGAVHTIACGAEAVTPSAALAVADPIGVSMRD